jgi:hypothetical protein
MDQDDLSGILASPPAAMTRTRSRAVHGDVDLPGAEPGLKRSAFEHQSWQTHLLQDRDKIGRLLRLFSSPRRRFGLTPDELLIFFAIGYRGTTMTHGAVQVTPISLIEVSSLLGIPKETVRRKTARLADLDYVICTPKGVVVKEVKLWCDMLGKALF